MANKKVLRTEEQKDQEFLEAYKKLCDKHKRGLSFIPGWRFSQDGNDFRLIVNIQVSRQDGSLKGEVNGT